MCYCICVMKDLCNLDSLFIFHSIILVLLVVGLFVFMIVYILLLFPTLTLINKLFWGFFLSIVLGECWRWGSPRASRKLGPPLGIHNPVSTLESNAYRSMVKESVFILNLVTKQCQCITYPCIFNCVVFLTVPCHCSRPIIP